jgi:biotin synthase
MKGLITRLYEENNLTDAEYLLILDNIDMEVGEYLFELARKKRDKIYSNVVFARGLIEFTNICKQGCKYCGLQSKNKSISRYRMDVETILNCTDIGYSKGYRTFVLQGGEDDYFSDSVLEKVVKNIKSKYPDVAITLSVGERSFESYKRLYDAGADRYLLRHETANKELYNSLHPNMSYENRMDCLKNLKEIGYQVGAGFMVGLPNQQNYHLVKDLRFLKNLNPQMIGIGPFIPHPQTDLKNESSGDWFKTLIMISLTRLTVPDCLLPATTAMGSLVKDGRQMAISAGANVIMPNISPTELSSKYELYKNKASLRDDDVDDFISAAGCKLDMSRGDHINWR